MERTFVVTVQPNGDYELWEVAEGLSTVVSIGGMLSSGSLLDPAQVGVDLYAAADLEV